MSTPQRIQRRRTKGWRMPEGAVYVGRPTVWGNPFVVHSEEIVQEVGTDRDWWCWQGAGGARKMAVELYREWMVDHLDLDYAVRALAGHGLACWCPLDQPCHADVLLELANGGRP